MLDDGHPQYNDPDHPKFYDLNPHQAHGSVYARIPAHRGYLRPTGQWNFQESTIVGHTVKVELNGFVILEADVSKVDPETFMYPMDQFHRPRRDEGPFRLQRAQGSGTVPRDSDQATVDETNGVGRLACRLQGGQHVSGSENQARPEDRRSDDGVL